MEQINIFSLANTTQEKIEKEYHEYINSVNQEKREPLVNFNGVLDEESTISLNVKSKVLMEMFNGSHYLNIYEYSEILAKQKAIKVDQILKERLKNYYLPRITFDSAIENGTKLYYCSLNIGNVGLFKFGYYNLNYSTDLFDDNNICYLEDDSLKSYMLDEKTVNFERLENCIANNETKSYFITLKHKHQIVNLEAHQLAEMVCNNDTYIEVIHDTKMTISDIKEMRFPKKKYTDLQNKHRMKKITRDETIEFQNLNKIMRLAKENCLHFRKI